MPKTIDFGKVSEYAFAAELLDRDIVPCWPSSEMWPYDMIADTGKNLHRIQVKSTRKEGPTIYMDVRKAFNRVKHARKYTKKDTDFVVIHVWEYDTWYLIPVEKIGDSVTLKPGNPNCRWAAYRHAWHLLAPKDKRR